MIGTFSNCYEHRKTGWARIRHKCHIICITECYHRNVTIEMLSWKCSRDVLEHCPRAASFMNQGRSVPYARTQVLPHRLDN